MSDITGAATSVERFDEEGRAGEGADRAGDADLRDDLPVDVAELPVREPGGSVVPISARWTVAEAAAGLVPMASSSVVDVTP